MLFPGADYALPPDPHAEHKSSVDQNAEEANLRQGDVIVSVNGETVESVDQFERAVTGFESGDRIRLRVFNSQGYRVVVLRLK